MARTYRIPAIEKTAAFVLIVLEDWWKLQPPALIVSTLGAIMQSTFDRPTTLKRHAAVLTTIPVDLGAFFRVTLTPQFAVAMLDDLCLEGLLTRQQASAAQHYVLGRTDKSGCWKDHDAA